jgi:translocator protein
MFKSSKKQPLLSLGAAILIPQIVGLLGARATSTSIQTWYRQLRKPSWNPPASIFGPVWTFLFLLMGIASWIAGTQGKSSPQVKTALRLYSLQLGFNLLWSVLFFGARKVNWALAELGFLWVLIFETTRKFFQIRPTAGWLMLPYQLWTTFAAALNTSIWWLNRENR